MTTLYINEQTGIKINITTPAERLLGPKKVQILVVNLTELMAALRATGAHVCRRGTSLEITVRSPEGWTSVTPVKRGP